MPEAENGDPKAQAHSPHAPQSPVRTFAVPKTRSSGNVDEQNTLSRYASPTSRSSSIDQDANGDNLQPQRVIQEHEHSIAPSGLHRIRQPPQRNRSTPSLQTRSTSMTIQIPASGHLTGPSSPVLPTSEDLVRFPSESLHSFSFTKKTNDFLQMRHNVLKRSVDLLKDRGMWAAGGLGTASAHAKISGDQEARSMIELLDKANLLGSPGLGSDGLGLSMAPLTGPAQMSGDNIFDKSFATTSESPEPMSPVVERGQEAKVDGTRPLQTPSLTLDMPKEPPRYSGDEPTSAPVAPVRRPGRPIASLKRTFTDIAPLSLQSRLTEALAQPYIADDHALLSPNAIPAYDPSNMTSFPGFTPHAHGRNTPLSQAIFTTESQPPYTITAANDLACLAFGVQKAELRKLSILDVVREDKRKWLESKLAGARATSVSSTPPKSKLSPSPSRTSMMGNGVTARLLSKPSSRETGQGRRTKSDDGEGSSVAERKNFPRVPAQVPKSGVLLCGDVLPIQKRNGDEGSATLWVQEKRDKLIWVMEEVAEDVAYLTVDEIGCVTKVSGKSEAVWGMEHVRRGMDVTRMIPDLPRMKGTNTGALDYDRIANLRRFTARTANDISIPITVDEIPGQPTFRVSSFPHIAGMMILSASTLEVSNSNTVVSEALFGRSANGMSMNALIPDFDKMLKMLVEDDQIQLIEGMVIPEHSFRRARAMLALREGKAGSAAVFLRPNGLPALHRDGAQIMVDVQMRVVKSETFGLAFNDRVIPEDEEDALTMASSKPMRTKSSEVVYAVWVTYSRALHAVNHGIGPVSPLVSRPSTPPIQPSPGHAVVVHEESESDDTIHDSSARTSGNVLTPPLESAGMKLSRPSSETKLVTGSLGPESTGENRKSMTIADYTILEEMGAGAYGQVKLARPKPTAPAEIRQFSKVVIKYVTKRRILVDTWTRDRKLGTVPLEIHVLDYLRRDGLRHENIVEMIDFFEDDINYYILMKPHGLPGMDLFDYIELRVNMEEEECRRIFKQVVSAVHFLHTKAKVVHRDIKDENVILDGEGRIKLIDFGSASYIKNGPFDVFVGTIDYAAPEVLSGAQYDGLGQDMWALGILLYTILYKENPFYSIDEIMDRDLRVPYIVSEESIQLVRGMLDRDVEHRLGIEEVSRSEWVCEPR